VTLVMSADSAVTYTSVHSEVRSWSIPSVDPYEEAAQQLLEHAPPHIPEHPEDLVPAKDEAPIEAYDPEVASAPTPPLPPSFLSPRIRPPHTRAAMTQMRAVVPSTYHSLLPSGTPPFLPIPLPVGESSAAAAARQPGPTMARSVDYSFVDTMETRFRDTKRRMMTALEMVNMRVSYQVDVRSRETSEFYLRHHDAQKDRAAVRAEIKTRRHEWQRQTADDLAVQHIMRTQALEAGARIETLEDTGSSS
nr:hypothetical protein [Tanacetum cinerariifolium]